MGWSIRESSTRLLAAEQRGQVQDHLCLHQFLCGIVTMLVTALIVLIHAVVAIFSSHMPAQQVFWGAIHRCFEQHCMCMCHEPL